MAPLVRVSVHRVTGPESLGSVREPGRFYARTELLTPKFGAPRLQALLRLGGVVGQGLLDALSDDFVVLNDFDLRVLEVSDPQSAGLA